MSKPLVLDGPHGRIEVAGAALEQLVAGAVQTVEGASLVRGRRAVDLTLEEGSASVAVSLAVGGARVIPAVGEDVQRAVADALGSVAGLTASVDVTVVEVTA